MSSKRKRLGLIVISIIIASFFTGYIVGVSSNGGNPTIDPILGVFNFPWGNFTKVNAEEYYQNGELFNGSGGVTDHGALTGLGDDDHGLYLLQSGVEGLTGNWDVGNYDLTAKYMTADEFYKTGIGNYSAWIESISGEGGVTDHGALTGLDDDDHSIYVDKDGAEGLTGDWDVGNYGINASWFDSEELILGGVSRTTWPSSGGAEGGVAAPNYIIFKNATATYMFNGATGAIDWWHTTSSNIFSACKGNLTGTEAKGVIYVKGGTYDITASIPVGKQTHWIGAGVQTVILSVSQNVNCFTIDSCASGVSSWKISGFTIDMNDNSGDGIHGDYSSNSAQAHSELSFLRIIDGASGQSAIYLKRPMGISGHDIRVGGPGVDNNWNGDCVTFESVVGDSINWGNLVWYNCRFSPSGSNSIGMNFIGNEGSDLLNLMHFYYMCIIGTDQMGQIAIQAEGLYWTTFYGVNIEDCGTGVYLVDACLQVVIDGNYIASCTNHSVWYGNWDNPVGAWVRSCKVVNCKMTSTNEEYYDYNEMGSVGISDSYAYNWLDDNRFDASPNIVLGVNTIARGNHNYNEHQVIATPFNTSTETIDGNSRYVCSPDQGSTGTATSGRKYLVIGRDIVLGVYGGADVTVEIWEFDQTTKIAEDTSGFWYLPVGFMFEITWTTIPTITVAAD